jgi:uncharacterized integral membrane protein
MMPSDGRPDPGASSGFRPNGRQIVGGVIAIVLVVFIAINNDDTSINLLFKEVTLPLWLVLAVTALLGVLVGVGLGTRRTKRKYMNPG